MQSYIQKQSYGSVTIFSRNDAVVTAALRELTGRLTHHPEVMAIVLFGSMANGRAGLDSDVDLLLVLRDHPQPFLERVAMYRPDTFPTDIDIFPYTLAEVTAGQPLAKVALDDGRVLWQHPHFIRPDTPEKP